LSFFYFREYFRLENHSKVDACLIYWTIIKPLDDSGAETSDRLKYAKDVKQKVGKKKKTASIVPNISPLLGDPLVDSGFFFESPCVVQRDKYHNSKKDGDNNSVGSTGSEDLSIDFPDYLPGAQLDGNITVGSKYGKEERYSEISVLNLGVTRNFEEEKIDDNVKCRVQKKEKTASNTRSLQLQGGKPWATHQNTTGGTAGKQAKSSEPLKMTPPANSLLSKNHAISARSGLKRSHMSYSSGQSLRILPEVLQLPSEPEGVKTEEDKEGRGELKDSSSKKKNKITFSLQDQKETNNSSKGVRVCRKTSRISASSSSSSSSSSSLSSSSSAASSSSSSSSVRILITGLSRLIDSLRFNLAFYFTCCNQPQHFCVCFVC